MCTLSPPRWGAASTNNSLLPLSTSSLSSAMYCIETKVEERREKTEDEEAFI